ncbi:invasion associated locus B family protein [Hoeflea sp. TYP-13]|uniref:invasion associated locus B family protein n=1 Tax=Hoeflea sp. TYP-13 TaxID=3230023 RepID=UPI0034C6681B
MTFRTSNVTRTALATAFAGAVSVALSSMSYAQAPTQRWYKVCTKQEDNDVCVVQNITTASTGQLLTAVGLITVEGKVNNKMLQVSVPSARTIPPGVGMQIDGGKSQLIPYSVCMPDKCVAQVPLTDAIIDSFKRGGEVVFTSVNFQRAPNPIKISLKGFTDAFDGEPVAQSELQERQRLLQEEMQRKAQAAREKLEAAQKKAKEEN